MICYACSETLGAKPFHDKETGRFYCETCREAIWSVIMNQNDPKTPKAPVLEPGEIELLPVEFDEEFDLEVDDYDFDHEIEDDFEGLGLPEEE